MKENMKRKEEGRGKYSDGAQEERNCTDLGAVDGKARCRVQLLVADVTFEVLGFLVVDQYLVVVKLPVAVPDHAKRKTP